ncbi:MAG: hypothetical protein AAB646_03030, partial [Patescibacteria group bacterium]
MLSAARYFYRPTLFAIALIASALLLPAIFAFGQEADHEARVDAALGDLSEVYGQKISNVDQAKALCNLERFVTDCAEIGKKHNLFDEEEIKQVDTVLSELKGKAIDDLKNCQDDTCLVSVASKLAERLVKKNAALAKDFDLTPGKVKEKEVIVKTAKDLGVDFETCRSIDPDTASTDILRSCAKLAKHKDVQKYLPEEAKKAAESQDASLGLQTALRAGDLQCGDNTIDGCGNYCLNPSPEARKQGVSAIPAVCRGIASRFFGSEGLKQLENAYNQVQQVADYYVKKAENVTFTTADGRTLTDPALIGRYMEEEGKRGNVEAVERGMEFLVGRGFVKPEEKDFALRMVRKIKEKGQEIDFDACRIDPEKCRDFVHENDRGNFRAQDQIHRIIETAIQQRGVPQARLCSQPQYSETCHEATRSVLPQLRQLAEQSPETRSFVAEIESRFNDSNKGLEARRRAEDKFRSGEKFSIGEKTFNSFTEMEAFCRENGALCLAEAAKNRWVDRDFAAEKYERTFETHYKGPYPRFVPPGPDGLPPGRVPGFVSPGPGFGLPPGIDKEAALKKFKEWLDNPQGPPPVPTEPRLIIDRSDDPSSKFYIPPDSCPQYSYARPCPEGYYKSESRDERGCYVPGECVPIPGYEKRYRQQPGQLPGVSQAECEQRYKEGYLWNATKNICYRPAVCPATFSSICPNGYRLSEVPPWECPSFDRCVPIEQPSYPNSGVYLKQLFSGQFNNTKYSVVVYDPEGVESFSVTKPDGTQLYGGNPSCSREVTSGTVTLVEPGDFPLKAKVSDCQKPSSQYLADVWPPSQKPIEPPICPSLPTVSECPAGEEKYVTYTSRDCGTYYGCRKAQPSTPVSFPYKFINGYTVNTLAEAKAYCLANGSGSGAGIAAECETKFGVVYSTSGSSCDAALKNLLGEGCHQMYTDNSGNYIFCNGPMTKSAKRGDTATTPGCVSPTSGTAQCSDGRDNDSDGQIDYPADTGCYDKYDSDEGFGNQPTPTDKECAELESLIPGCHQMPESPTARFNSDMTKYVNIGTKIVKSCSTDFIAGCSPSLTPTPIPGSSCDSYSQSTCINTAGCRWNNPVAGTGSPYCSLNNYGDATTCPGFAHSRWDANGKRFCQLNNSSGCSAVYPEYLDISNYNSYKCPASSSTTAPPSPDLREDSVALCADRIDNDRDGMIDGADPSCAPYVTITPTTAQCSDGRDNDGDGLIDYPADTGCYSKEDNDESSVSPSLPVVSTCSSLTTSATCEANASCDWPGSLLRCLQTGAYEDLVSGGCTNGIDDDRDGLIDRADPACSGSTTGGGTATGSCTAEQINLLGSGCHSMGNAYFDGAMAKYMLPGATAVNNCSTNYISGCTVWSTGGGSGCGTKVTSATCETDLACDWIGSSCSPAAYSSPTSACDTSLKTLLGDGCHYMYNDSSGRSIYCDGAMTKSAKQGDTVTITGCTSPTGGGSTTGLYEDSVALCSDGIDNDRDGFIDRADPSCAGYCPAGQSWSGTACVTTTTTGSTCPSIAHEMSGYCMLNSDTSRCAEYSSASSEANYTSAVCQAHTGSTSTTSTSCGTGYYWNGSTCVVNTTTTTTCPAGQYWNGTACVNTSTTDTATTCPSGQYWNGSACVTTTTTT